MKPISRAAFRIVISISAPIIWTVSVSAQTQKPAEEPRNVSTAASGVKYQPLNIKPGLWERTVTYKIVGDSPIPAGMLDKLTPEQRSRFQARMDASSAANTRTNTERVCITKQQVEKPVDFSDKECTWTILESTSTRANGKVSCHSSGITMSGTGDFAAPDPEHLKGSAHMTSTGNGNKISSDATFTSRWIQSNCGNVQ